jgi:hypothetical protein
MKRLALIVLFLNVIPLFVNASDYPGALFLTIYPGARAVGMAGAFTAIADDALASYYNPAGLAYQDSKSLSLNHTDWLPMYFFNMHHNYISVALPIYSKITISPSINYLVTQESNLSDIASEDWKYDISPGISIGAKLLPDVGIGATLKYIYSHQPAEG